MMNSDLKTRPRTPPSRRAIITALLTVTTILPQVALGMRSQVARLSKRGLHSTNRQGLQSAAALYPPSFAEIRKDQRHFAFACRQMGDSRLRLFSSSQFEALSLENAPNDEKSQNDAPDSDDELIGSISSDEEDDKDHFTTLPKGSNEGFFVVRTYKTSESGFDMDALRSMISDDDIDRLDLKPGNISAPVAMMILDPDKFPSLSRARKACRKAHVMIHRGPLAVDEDTGKDIFDPQKCLRARVGDRVFPGDVLAKQTRMGDGYFPQMNHQKPPFDLPVVYEDDYFCIVNKPGGVVVYAHRQGGHGIMTIRAALPFAVKPPKAGTYSTLRFPQPVHRLDKPTSGLLIAAKTKPAMVDLSGQFANRKVKKTYIAICNGIPPELPENSISSQEAYDLGVDVDPHSDEKWQLIDHPLDEKSAVTIWRAVKYAKSLKANQNYVTLVELKPKTGRYHQLRRHMAWVCERPLVGDSEYDGGGDAMQLRERGLFLCSSRVTLEHPFYNSEEGRIVFDKIPDSEKAKMEGISVGPDGKVMVKIEIDVPDKFESFMTRENDRFERLSTEEK